MVPFPKAVSRRFRFDGFEIDALSGELRRDGVRIPLQRVPLRFLLLLLEHAGELVTREELRACIWPPDLHMDFEDALGTAARKVRQALEDSSRSPVYLETLPGRGYRFLRTVETEPEVGSPPGPAPIPEGAIWIQGEQLPVAPEAGIDRRFRRKAGLSALALLLLGTLGWFLWRPWVKAPFRNPTLVVLPTKVHGPIESAFLTDAIPDSLSTLLAGVRDIETKAPPSSVDLERLQGNTEKVVAAYGADHLLLTAVTVQGDRLLLNAQLVQVPSRKVRWATQLEGSLGSYNELLHVAVVAIARELKPAGRVEPPLGRPVFGSKVEVALREGQYFQRRYGAGKDAQAFEQALSAFRRAQAVEPSNAQLLAEIGGLFHTQYFNTRDPLANAESERWTARALELDPACGRAWAIRAWIEASRPRVEPSAVTTFALKAAHFAPNDPQSYIMLGSVAPTNAFQAASGFRCMELDPLNTLGYSWAAMCLTSLGRADEGVRIAEQAIRVEDSPGFHTWIRFYSLFYSGRVQEAKEAYTEVQWKSASRLMRCLLDGDIEAGRKLALEQVEKWRTADSGAMDWVNRLAFFGPLLVRLGLREETLWLLERSTATNFPPALDFLLLEHDLLKLRGDPRYIKAVASSRAYAATFLALAEEASARGEFPRCMEPALLELRELMARTASGI